MALVEFGEKKLTYCDEEKGVCYVIKLGENEKPEVIRLGIDESMRMIERLREEVERAEGEIARVDREMKERIARMIEDIKKFVEAF